LREKVPILCGGTGLYLSAILKRYQLTRADFSDWKESPYYEKTLEELREIALQKKIPLHNTTDWLDKDRLLKALIICDSEGEKISAKEANYLVIGLNIDPETNRKLIKERLYKRIREGMIEEVELLLKMGLTHEKLRFFGLEYRYISLYLNGELNKNDAIQKLYSAICDYAKRQRTWFRKMEKEGLKINWIKYYDFESAEKIAYDFLKGEKA
jgi:tRNA dimethylallyltransferase